MQAMPGHFHGHFMALRAPGMVPFNGHLPTPLLGPCQGLHLPISPEGDPFDPEKHEAISVLEDEKEKPNTVIEVIQRGFTIQNRILRPAKVVVTKKADNK